jgi:DNA invertase Pin-like site-specific DNA recombinase
MRVVGYIRVSGKEQLDGTSLDVQRNQIDTYCLLKGMELINVYCDAAVSGGKPIDERPKGSRLMDAVRSGEIQAIVVTKLDRGFRNTVDCLSTVDELDKFNVALHIIDLGGNSIDSQSPAGRFMLTVLAAAAEMERGMIRDRCNSGRSKKRNEGKLIGGVPFGYKADSDNTLIANPSEQSTLKLIRDLHSSGNSVRKIADKLNLMGIASKKGRLWNHVQIMRILQRAA